MFIHKMTLKGLCPLLVLLMMPAPGKAQSGNTESVHSEESRFYKKNPRPIFLRDKTLIFQKPTEKPGKMIFGYHPYWSNDSWSEYQWDLLTDLCYFSYEVNPYTGLPETLNGFETAAVIDSALAHGVKVHLCVTLFSGHQTFFSNPAAWDTLNHKLTELAGKGRIQGLNLDFEAVPQAQSGNLTSYVECLRNHIDTAAPELLLSMATPAVNWNQTFQIAELNPLVDFFMVMTYDYYWNLSSTAGPVAPLYPMESGYLYSASRSIEYYLTQGVAPEKILMGIPYYGRIWPVTRQNAPATTRGSGSAITYRNVRRNPSLFSWNNRRTEPESGGIYYAYDMGGWNHCFIDEPASLRKKYDRVTSSGLGGIGIWALGYDVGYSDLWNLIAEAFTGSGGMACQDTLYDHGGKNNSPTAFTAQSFELKTSYGGPLTLTFPNLSLTDARLDIYPESDTLSIPVYSFLPGDPPATVAIPGQAAFLRFSATGSLPSADFAIEWKCPSFGIESQKEQSAMIVYPNPARDFVSIRLDPNTETVKSAGIRTMDGRILWEKITSGRETVFYLPSYWPSGMYIAVVQTDQRIYTGRFILL